MPGSSWWWWCNQIQQCPEGWDLHAVPVLRSIILTACFSSSQSAAAKGCSIAAITAPACCCWTEGQYMMKGLGREGNNFYLEEIWLQVTFLFPSCGATTFFHSGGMMNKVYWWEGKGRMGRRSKRTRTVQLNYAMGANVFCAHRRTAPIVFIGHNVSQLLRLLWH